MRFAILWLPGVVDAQYTARNFKISVTVPVHKSMFNNVILIENYTGNLFGISPSG
jgi:hypothetical protein